MAAVGQADDDKTDGGGEQQRLRIGIAGAGRWGRILLGALKSMPDVAVTAVASRQADVGALLPEGAVRVAGWDQLLDPDLVDALVVASPASTHAAIACAGLALGLPLFVEKPLAVDAAAAAAVRRVARAQRLPVIVDHVDLYNPAFVAVAEAADALAGGGSVTIEAGRPAPVRADCSTLWDWGPHALAMALRLIGTQAALSQAQVTGGEAAGGLVYDIALNGPRGTASVRFGNGMSERTRRATLRQGDTMLRYDDVAAAKAVRSIKGREEELVCGQTPPVTAALTAFVHAARRARGGGENAKGDDLDLAVAVVALLAQIELRFGTPP